MPNRGRTLVREPCGRDPSAHRRSRLYLGKRLVLGRIRQLALFDIEDFNKRVVTENFNRVVCDYLAEQIDPTDATDAGKTLVFCVNDQHADMVVRLLKAAFDERYSGVDNNAVMKITGAADQPMRLIRRYKNEPLPNVAVTVDLLTTGIDVPEIANVVFLRRVRSRILYEQMLGRGTRLRPDLHGPGKHKEAFRIFDAVDLTPPSSRTPR